MSVRYNPSIVTAGLTFAIDPANIKSYPGSGTTVTDIVSFSTATGFTGMAVSNNTFTTGGGCINNFSSSISSAGTSRTVCSFFNIIDTNRRAIAGTRQLDANFGWVFTVNRSAPGNLTYFHTGLGTAEFAAGIVPNQWYFGCATYDIATSRADVFLNAVNLGNVTPFGGNDLSTNLNGTYGGENGAQWVGSLGPLLIYNRALSNTEIVQNYNAYRGRFGL